MRNVLISYIPALHKGYVNLFRSCGADLLYIIGEDIIASFPELDYVSRKDSIRALSSKEIKSAVMSWGIFKEVYVVSLDDVEHINRTTCDIIMPDEDVSRLVSARYFPEKKVVFHSIFLRWDRKNTTKKRELKCDEISIKDLAKIVTTTAIVEAQKSFDFWRQVAGVIVWNNKILLSARNKHLPCEQAPYIFGDPRAVFKRGIHIELSTAEHAEARLIAAAARKGFCLDGTEIFVTDFPCPPCAKLVAGSGIKKCYFLRGYAMLDGEKTLKDAGVEIIKVIE